MAKAYLGATGVAFVLMASFFALQNTSQSPARLVHVAVRAPRVAGVSATGSPVQLAVSANPYTLTVVKAGTGSGTVTSNLGGLNCGTTCTAAFASGANPILYAQAAPGSTLTGWGGDCTPGESPAACLALMNASKTVTATFTADTSMGYTLTVNNGGAGDGTISSTPSGLNCTYTGGVPLGSCSSTFAPGTSVTLAATASSTSTFTSWTGCSSTTPVCTMVLKINTTVTAFFTTLTKPTLTVALSPDTPPAATVRAGQAHLEFTKFTLTATGGDVQINRFGLGLLSSDHANSVRNVQLSALTVVGTLTTLAKPGNSTNQVDWWDNLYLASAYVVSDNTTITFLIAADVSVIAAPSSLKLGLIDLGFSSTGSANVVWPSDRLGHAMTVAPPPPTVSLDVMLDPSTPPSATIQPGDANVTFTSLRLAALGANVAVSSIIIGLDSLAATSSITNLRVLAAGSSATVAPPAAHTYGAGYTVTFSPAVLVPAYGVKTLSLVADATSSATGTLHLALFELVSWTPTTAPLNLTGDLPYWGNKMYVGTPVANPDLVITDVQVMNAYPSGGTTPHAGDQWISGQVTVQNQGTNVALFGGFGATVAASIHAPLFDPSTIEIAASGPAAAVSGDGTIINPGESRVYSFSTRQDPRLYTSLEFLASPGSKLLYFTVDPGNVTSDAIRDNNMIGYTLTVLPPSGALITVSSPHAGEQWQLGSTYTISWQNSDTPPPGRNVQLFTSQVGLSNVCLVANSVPDTGSYSWTLPATRDPGCQGNQVLKVLRLDGSNMSGQSGTFSIVAAAGPSLRVTAPNGGEVWRYGTTQTISWIRSGTYPDSFRQSVELINMAQPNVGINIYDAAGTASSFQFPIASKGLVYASANVLANVPAPAPGQYKVHIFAYVPPPPGGDTNTVLAEDYSDAPFTITSVPPPVITALKAPEAGSYAFKLNWSSGAANINFYDARRVIDLTVPAPAGATSLNVNGSPLPNVSYMIFDATTQFREYLNIGSSVGMTAFPTIQLTTPLVGTYTTRAQIVPLLGSYWGQMPTPVGPVNLGTFQQDEEIKIGFVTQFHESLLGPFVSLDPKYFFYAQQPTPTSYNVTIDDGVQIGPLDANFEVYQGSVVSPYPITFPTFKANNPFNGFVPPYPPTQPFSTSGPLLPSSAVFTAPSSLDDIMSDASAVASNNVDEVTAVDQGEVADLLNRAEVIIIKIKALQNELATITPQLKDFIALGTLSTQKLGAGERAGVVSSFTSTFGKAPSTEADWQDVIKIANGRWPTQRSDASEQQAEERFVKIYQRESNRDANVHDDAAVTVMAYGLRPTNRNLTSEAAAIKSFVAIFGHDPVTAEDWDAVRAIAYSGATR